MRAMRAMRLRFQRRSHQRSKNGLRSRNLAEENFQHGTTESVGSTSLKVPPSLKTLTRIFPTTYPLILADATVNLSATEIQIANMSGCLIRRACPRTMNLVEDYYELRAMRQLRKKEKYEEQQDKRK